jgi:hypothetical protein
VAKKKPENNELDEQPAELPDPERETEPEIVHEVAPAVDPAPAREIAAAESTPVAAEDADHRRVHGADSIVDDEHAYNLWRGGQRFVHVGEYGGQWVYRPD